MRRLALVAALACAATPLLAQNHEPAGTGTVVLKAARLIDGTGAAPVSPAVVVVTDDKIVSVGSTVPESARNARVVDLGNATLLPGFIDAHVHLIGRSLGDPEQDDAPVRDYDGFAAILGAANAQKTLLAGFTSVRNVGAPDFNDMALRRAIQEGFVAGPRMENAGYAIGITGGHCDENGFKPGLMDGDPHHGIADGVDQVREAVRYMAKSGADVIKTCATGGVLSEGDAVGVPQYTYEELKALVDEATKLERKVAAHAHGTEGIKIAVRAGVTSIEHGSFLDDEGAQMMADRGTWLVPTLSAGEAAAGAAHSGALKGLRAQKAVAAFQAMQHAIRIAHDHHVKIALGTDAGVDPHGQNAHEFVLMTQMGGLSPMESIVAGTLNGARLLGWDRTVGSLAAGKLADVVAVPGNPLEDITALTRVSFVMKNGYVYKMGGAPATALP